MRGNRAQLSEIGGVHVERRNSWVALFRVIMSCEALWCLVLVASTNFCIPESETINGYG